MRMCKNATSLVRLLLGSIPSYAIRELVDLLQCSVRERKTCVSCNGHYMQQ